MTKLLSKQSKWLWLTLLLEVIILGIMVVLYYYLPDFQYYYVILIGITSCFILLDFIFGFTFNFLIKKKKGHSEMKSADIIGDDISEAYEFGMLGLAVCDYEDTIMWVNEFLGSRFNSIVDKNIFDVFPGLFVLSDQNYSKKTVKITIEDKTYEVEFLKEARLYIFKDITSIEFLNNYSQMQSPVVGYISIDNYSDVQISIGDEAKFTDALSDLRKMIAEFGQVGKCLIRRIRDDRYLFITTTETYEKLYKDKFSIVDDVHNKFPNGFTLSIGVALGFPDYSKLAELASNALDVALSRGGDQTVIQPFSKPMIYIGGKTELLPSRNRVKIRTLSNSFVTILNNYKNVIIMPHTNADYDAIGSALGIYLLCKTANVPAKICWEDQLIDDKVRMAVEGLYDKNEMNEMFISMRNVEATIHETTLLVCCDHNNPKISIFPELIKKCHHIAIIDHHRPLTETIENPEFNGIDTSASSASELVTFYITYNQKQIAIDQRTATFLLSGICLDTHFYKEHATTNTFEASAQLKNFHADSAKVTDFLKEELEEYRQKISILNNCETPYYGCIVAMSPDNEIVSNITLSIVANEALNIKGIFMSFCIGRIDEHTVKISARSDGSVSVLMLIEKLGGGGHLAMAATAFKDTTVEAVRLKLLNVLKDYLNDAKLHPDEEK